ncbi:MAG TPA: hypothetical protein PK079_26375 [Leptospiraceae bacterium]|nr:hypothetical protein [Leptospiraceae bacterium]HMX35541.1 hypothetical protein [Leptospiraceae bacterium]HMY34450.1 hypothetical protein [Leptospiraceae bacterium]HMZ67558.1 hypothetical protein [Leptospiraceae bacterium]HNA10454.1 hypothetical protein [Leptospiraceae bacterium]
MSGIMKEGMSDAKNAGLILAGLAISKFVSVELLKDFDKEKKFKPLLIPIAGYFAAREVPIKWARQGLKEGFLVSLYGGGLDMLNLKKEKDYVGLAGDRDESDVRTFVFNGMSEVRDFADALVNKRQANAQLPPPVNNNKEDFIVHGVIVESSETDRVIQPELAGRASDFDNGDYTGLMGEYRYEGDPILNGDFE